MATAIVENNTFVNNTIVNNNSIKILIVCDKTGSMTTFLSSLKEVFYELYDFCRMVFPNTTFGCKLYGDYDSIKVTDTLHYTNNIKEIHTFLDTFAKARGGGSSSEAQKTAFTEIIEMVDMYTVVLHYTDASPHMRNDNSESKLEYEYFQSKQWSWEWSNIVNNLKMYKPTIVTISNIVGEVNAPYYKLLGETALCTLSVNDIMKTTMTEIQNIVGIYSDKITPFKMSFYDIAIKLQKDSVYFDNIVGILISQITRRNINAAINILSTKFTAEVYRTILPKRRNNMLVEKLKNLIDDCSNNPMYKNEDRTILQKLIAESYDRKAAFDELLEGKIQGTIKCYKSSLVHKFNACDLNTFFTEFSQNYAGHMITFIQSMVECNHVHNPGVSISERGIIPADIMSKDTSDKDFFSIITHLITPGYVCGSLKYIALMALLCLNDGRLKRRAINFLNSIKGKWLNFTLKEPVKDKPLPGFIYPENVNVGFVKFILNKREFLTETELQLLNDYITLLNIHKCSKPSCNLQVITSYQPNKVITTNLFSCDKCQLYRPISHRVIGTKSCAWCVDIDPCDLTTSVPNCNEKVKNVNCKTCNSIYAIVREEQLHGKKLNDGTFEKILPKCYYCRMNKIAPVVRCKLCDNKYIYPDHMGEEFLCTICMEEGLQTETSNITIKDLYIVNKNSLTNFTSIPDKEIDNILTNKDLTDLKPASLLERYIRNGKISNFSNISRLNTSPNIKLYNENKLYIHNSNMVLDNLYNVFSSVKNEKDTECSICNKGIQPIESVKICCNKSCTGIMCRACSYKWFDDIVPGNLIEISHCSCPFCRHLISNNIKKFHPIGRLKVSNNSIMLSLTNYMGWCISCNEIKVHSNLECNEERPSNVINFICNDCKIPQVIGVNKDRIVTCSNCSSPACKALVINNITNQGCNHIQCVACEYHVCAFENCGMAFKENRECYIHMSEIHNGYYNEDY